MNVNGAEQVGILKTSGCFDSEWYLDAYPEVRELDMDAAEHFLRIGVRIGRDPSPTCSNAQYLEMMATGDWNRSAPADGEAAATPVPLQQQQGATTSWGFDAVVTDANFDRDRYLVRYPEVAVQALDPLWHFKTFGFDEGRVGSFFDAKWYLSRHGDVGAHGFEAFDHYRLYGADEGWAARFVHIQQTGLPD